IAQAFFRASHDGDIGALRSLLAENVVIQSDGGGKVLAFRNPILGLEKALRLYEGLYRKFRSGPASWTQPQWIDGLPGFVSLERGILQTTAFEIEDGRIAAIYITRNPDKLARVVKASET
ncbi:MAG: polymerase ECF-type sigma factor, partial [Rubritepida sp.]|nr:polymerase ECF-type sigma factor [Rubritepida sp.]